MKKYIIRERESKKRIAEYEDSNKAFDELRRIANAKKAENEEDWDFYELIERY